MAFGAWADEGHGHGAKDKGKGYIRVLSPGGYEVVVGRANPLKELSYRLEQDAQGRAVKVFTLTVEDVEFEIYPGRTVQAWGFNGMVPGPTIRVRQGDRVRLVLKVQAEGEHTIHIHGLKKPTVMDGVPYVSHRPVERGQEYVYEFTALNPGTHIYHCHVDTAHHMDMGMYGAFIVEPQEEALRYDRDYILILDEWPTGHVHVHEAPMAGHQEHGVITEHPGPARHEHPQEAPRQRHWYPKTYRPYEPLYDTFVINGRAFPYTEPLLVKEGEVVRLRLINAGYMPHYIHVHAHKFLVVARDGNLLSEEARFLADTVEVGPGQRVDVLLKADNPGLWPLHCHDLRHVSNEHIYPGGMLTFIRYVQP